MIVFTTPGLIDIRAVTTMGVNAKETADAIGQFGTGLKYAIACILRWGGEIVIWRGLEQFAFSAVKASIRNKSFSIVHMNDTPLGFVTDYGKSWEPWQVYRELWSNTRDEKGTIEKISSRDGMALHHDQTCIVVSCPEIDEAHRRRDQFLLLDSRTPIFSSPLCDVYDTHGDPTANAVFYQGIRVYKNLSQLYTYNIKHKVDLTEDRTLKHYWEADYACIAAVSALCQGPLAHKVIAERILLAPNDTFERQVCYGLSGLWEPLSAEFFALCEQLYRRELARLNHTVVELVRQRRPELSIDQFLPSEFQQAMLARAIEFSRAIGFAVDEYPIVCVERMGSSILGLALNKTIYISRAAFELGTKGELAILIAAAQFNGIDRSELTILTGYKRSSRDAYIQRLREKNYIEIAGQNIKPTHDGLAALPSDYETLPTGAELREYWLNRLPEGEKHILKILIGAYPSSLPRDALDEATGYKRSSRDAYLQRLKAKRLWESDGTKNIRASDKLF